MPQSRKIDKLLVDFFGLAHIFLEWIVIFRIPFRLGNIFWIKFRLDSSFQTNYALVGFY